MDLSQVPQLQVVTRPTSGPHRGHTVSTPYPHRLKAGPARKGGGGGMRKEAGGAGVTSAAKSGTYVIRRGPPPEDNRGHTIADRTWDAEPRWGRPDGGCPALSGVLHIRYEIERPYRPPPAPQSRNSGQGQAQPQRLDQPTHRASPQAAERRQIGTGGHEGSEAPDCANKPGHLPRDQMVER
jgi:hypothetical protein